MRRRSDVWNWVVAYLIPGPVWRVWTRNVYDPIRARILFIEERRHCKGYPHTFCRHDRG